MSSHAAVLDDVPSRLLSRHLDPLATNRTPKTRDAKYEDRVSLNLTEPRQVHLNLQRVSLKDGGDFTCRVDFLSSPSLTSVVKLHVYGIPRSMTDDPALTDTPPAARLTFTGKDSQPPKLWRASATLTECITTQRQMSPQDQCQGAMAARQIKKRKNPLYGSVPES
ncbi:hypothetical protein O3P69_017317 [Scylla paramamosain]|uniref:Uncharacterized protein n=1 Tax=Scylla paramamosain TaxID=85552 RepID=A0AAW0TWP7_SCYPA